jgi:hypothetical protein
MALTESNPQSEVGSAAPTLGSGLFARKSTGLVREVSGKQQIFWNFLSGFPPYGLALGVFVALSGFPGGNLVVAALLAIPLALVLAYVYGLLTAVMPRTGGDYVYVSRIPASVRWPGLLVRLWPGRIYHNRVCVSCLLDACTRASPVNDRADRRKPHPRQLGVDASEQ